MMGGTRSAMGGAWWCGPSVCLCGRRAVCVRVVARVARRQNPAPRKTVGRSGTRPSRQICCASVHRGHRIRGGEHERATADGERGADERQSVLEKTHGYVCEGVRGARAPSMCHNEHISIYQNSQILVSKSMMATTSSNTMNEVKRSCLREKKRVMLCTTRIRVQTSHGS